MKYLKTIDFAGQSFIFGGYLIGSVFVLIAEQRWDSLGMTTLMAMLCLGWWQMIAALILLVFRAPNRKQRLIHFLTAVVYLAILSIGAKLSNSIKVDNVSYFMRALVMTLVSVPPLVLAIFYYTITWRWMFPRHSTGKFLPHTSF